MGRHYVTVYDIDKAVRLGIVQEYVPYDSNNSENNNTPTVNSLASEYAGGMARYNNLEGRRVLTVLNDCTDFLDSEYHEEPPPEFIQRFENECKIAEWSLG